MTTAQKAIAALIASGGIVAGTVSTGALKSILSGTCRMPETKLEQVLPGGGKQTTLTLQQAVNIIGQNCRDPGNGSVIVDTIEVKLISPGKQ